MTVKNLNQPDDLNQVNNTAQWQSQDAPELKDLISALWQGKWLVITTALISIAIAVIVALNLPNIYRSEVVVTPSQESQGGGLSALANQFGGLASLAGVNLGNNNNDKSALALQILQSRDFITKFVAKYDLVLPLMAAKSWDPISNRIFYEPKIYDENNKLWIREASPLKTAEPTNWEIYNRFIKLLEVNQDKKNGVVIIAIEHVSPLIAQKWASNLVKEINLTMKQSEIDQTQKSISYLTEQLQETSIAEMQKVFYQLIEEQTKSMMLAQVREEYVFMTIDPAVVAEDKASPKRALIVVVAMMLGGLLGIFITLIRYYRQK